MHRISNDNFSRESLYIGTETPASRNCAIEAMSFCESNGENGTKQSSEKRRRCIKTVRPSSDI